jgi:hypothetical protein
VVVPVVLCADSDCRVLTCLFVLLHAAYCETHFNKQFMEHDVEALPIRISVLADLAQKCHAYAKVHYSSYGSSLVLLAA